MTHHHPISPLSATTEEIRKSLIDSDEHCRVTLIAELTDVQWSSDGRILPSKPSLSEMPRQAQPRTGEASNSPALPPLPPLPPRPHASSDPLSSTSWVNSVAYALPEALNRTKIELEQAYHETLHAAEKACR